MDRPRVSAFYRRAAQKLCSLTKQARIHQKTCSCTPVLAKDNLVVSHSPSGLQGIRRRAALLMTVAGVCLAALPAQPVHAKHKPVEYTDAETLDAATSATEFKLHTDEDQLFSLLVPAGWRAANLPDRSGVLASWYNPYEPGVDTMAVYQREQLGIDSVQQLGTPQTLGQALASSTPDGTLLHADEYRDEQGRVYYCCQVQFDGASAARFRSVQEFRTVSCHGGSVITLRATTTTYRLQRFAEVRAEMDTLTRSLRLGTGT